MSKCDRCGKEKDTQLEAIHPETFLCSGCMDKHISYKWQLRFMSIAQTVSTWSKDPTTKVGCLIVRQRSKSVIAMGYNGFPKKLIDDISILRNREEKLKRIVHAEQNAILFRASSELRGTWLFTTMFPCITCTKLIIQSGISVVAYKNHESDARWQEEHSYSRKMMEEAKIWNIYVPEIHELSYQIPEGGF